MIIDNLVNIPVAQEPDVRIKRKNEVEGQRPVEESEKGNNLGLNFKNEENEKRIIAEDSRIRGEIEEGVYNSTGKLSNEMEAGPEIKKDSNIDLIV